MFLGDTTEKSYAKTAFGLRDWAPDRCVGEWSCGGATVSTDLPRLTPKEARARGAKALVIGVANLGGVINESWLPSLVEALDSGLDIISGMHAKLDSVPQLKQAAELNGRKLFDVRTPPPKIPIATGRKRSGKRLLTVGTDCALGARCNSPADPPFRTRPGIYDLAHALHTERVGEWGIDREVATTATVDLVEVENAGGRPYQDLARPRGGVGRLEELEGLGRAAVASHLPIR